MTPTTEYHRKQEKLWTDESNRSAPDHCDKTNFHASFLPTAVVRSDVTGSTSTSLIPVFTRSSPLSDYAGLISPYSKTLRKEKEKKETSYFFGNRAINHSLNSREEGYLGS